MEQHVMLETVEEAKLLNYALYNAPSWMRYLFWFSNTDEKRRRRAERLIKWAREHGCKLN